MKYAILSALVVFLSVFSAKGSILDNPAMRIHTDNMENTFGVGGDAVFFVEILTNFQYPSGGAEIVLEGIVVGNPPIILEGTKISETYYSFISPELQVSDVGMRYFQAHLKTRPKKETNKIRKAIEANSSAIEEAIVKRDAATSESMRTYYQMQIDQLDALIVSLENQLDGLFTTVGAPAELAFRVQPVPGQVVNVLTSHKFLTVAEGESAEYEIALDSRPTSDVTITIYSEADDITLNENGDNQVKLLFTPENYNIPQKVKVGVSANSTADDSREALIHHEAYSLDERYDNMMIESLSMEVLDGEAR